MYEDRLYVLVMHVIIKYPNKKIFTTCPVVLIVDVKVSGKTHVHVYIDIAIINVLGTMNKNELTPRLSVKVMTAGCFGSKSGRCWLLTAR